MNRTRRIRTIGRGVVLVLVLVAAIVLGGCNSLRREGPAMPTATSTSVSAAQARAKPPTATPLPTETAVPSPTPTATEAAPAMSSSGSKEKPACGEGTLTVLLLGEADPERSPGRGADAIRYVQVDFDRSLVRVLAIPPDLQMDAAQIPSLESDLVTLTTAYFRAKLRPGSERVKMVEEVVDELGGLHIYIPEDVVGWPDGMGVFTKGWHDLEGWQVLEYVKIRTPGPEEGPVEYARLARQRQVLQALYAQLRQPLTLIRLPGLIRVYRRNVVTDLRLPQFLDLACVLGQDDLAVAYFAIGPDLVTPQDSILVPKTDEIRAFVEEIFGE
jgi:hypothetical protein